jgi:hypothetical protein
MKPIIKFTTYFFIAGVTFLSCKKETEPQKNHRPPLITASVSDGFIILPKDSVELKGAGVATDAQIVSYRWTKLSGPVLYTWVDSTAPITKVKSLVEGVYEFALTVSDDSGLSAQAKVWVTVFATCPCDQCDPWGDPCDPWDY